MEQKYPSPGGTLGWGLCWPQGSEPFRVFASQPHGTHEREAQSGTNCPEPGAGGPQDLHAHRAALIPRPTWTGTKETVLSFSRALNPVLSCCVVLNKEPPAPSLSLPLLRWV